MAPLLADVSQGQALRLYQVECLARRSRAAVERSLLRGLRASALRPGSGRPERSRGMWPGPSMWKAP